MPRNTKSHDDCRLSVCVLCFKKGKQLRKITAEQEKIIKKYISPKFDLSEAKYPCVICGTCRIQLLSCGKEKKFENVYVSHHLKKLPNLPTITRSSGNSQCKCIVCYIAKQSPITQSKSNGISKKVEQTKSKSTFKAEKMCNYCLSIIGKGLNHRCNTSSRCKNLGILMNSSLPTTKEHITSAVIKDKVAASSSQSVSKQISLSNVKGRPSTIVIPKNAKKTELVLRPRQMLSSADMSKIQTNLNLSTNQAIELGKNIRSVTHNRKAIENNLSQKLASISHVLDTFFESTKLSFGKSSSGGKKETIERSVVFCNDLNRLIHFVWQKRNYTDETHVKLGIDGGGGFLKLCLSFSNPVATGLKVRKNSDYGVKKIIVIAIAPDVQENYENVSKIWCLLNLNNLQATYKTNISIATDLKLANIICGLMTHSSAHPCTWCDISKTSLSSAGVMRTSDNICDKYQLWLQSGGDRKKAKLFGNCVNIPIFSWRNSSTQIINVLPPPELHLMLGAVNTLFSAMLEKWPPIAMEWAQKCNVEREALSRHNSCRKLLRNVDFLEELCSIKQPQCVVFVKAFRTFNIVVSACFGMDLDPNYVQYIDAFRQCYHDTGVRITPKIHVIFQHIEDFCTPRKQRLGFWNEQASEAVHADFEKT